MNVSVVIASKPGFEVIITFMMLCLLCNLKHDRENWRFRNIFMIMSDMSVEGLVWKKIIVRSSD